MATSIARASVGPEVLSALVTSSVDPRVDLRADCSRCAALCCVATTLVRSSDFAIDKPAGVACPKLADDFGCSIHDRLRPSGFAGCAAYDCFGAGQRTVQETFSGREWRSSAVLAPAMFDAFAVMRPLHELLWLLTEAVDLDVGVALRGELSEAIRATERLTRQDVGALVGTDVEAHRSAVNVLLRRASGLARSGAPQAGLDLAGSDLLGKDLRGRDLRGASLRGSVLVATDLRGTRLELADLTGADLRGADVRGTDLSKALFLGQGQVAAARGDTDTSLPAWLDTPTHWTSG
jgi:hypothetical protein